MSSSRVERVVDYPLGLLPGQVLVVLVVDALGEAADAGHQGGEQVFRGHLAEAVVVPKVVVSLLGGEALGSLHGERRAAPSQLSKDSPWVSAAADTAASTSHPGRFPSPVEAVLAQGGVALQSPERRGEERVLVVRDA